MNYESLNAGIELAEAAAAELQQTRREQQLCDASISKLLGCGNTGESAVAALVSEEARQKLFVSKVSAAEANLQACTLAVRKLISEIAEEQLDLARRVRLEAAGRIRGLLDAEPVVADSIAKLISDFIAASVVVRSSARLAEHYGHLAQTAGYQAVLAAAREICSYRSTTAELPQTPQASA